MDRAEDKCGWTYALCSYAEAAPQELMPLQLRSIDSVPNPAFGSFSQVFVIVLEQS